MEELDPDLVPKAFTIYSGTLAKFLVVCGLPFPQPLTGGGNGAPFMILLCR